MDQRVCARAVHQSVTGSSIPSKSLRTRATLLIAALFLCLANANPAWAGGRERGDAVALLGSVPSGVELAVVVEELSSAWDSPAIATAISSVQAVTDLSGTLDAWSVLAERLDLTPDEAARRLLGRRFMLVSESEGDADSWAIAMAVDAETARLLRKKLDAIPRALRDGLPVLSIENNAFELVVHDRGNRRLTTAMGAGLDGGDAVVVLGPSSRSRVFDALLGTALGVGARGSTIDTESPGKIARALPDGTSVVVLKGEPGNPMAWFVLGAAIEENAIRMNFLRQNPEFATTRVTSVKPWRLNLFDRVSEGAMFAVAEVNELNASASELLGEAIGPDLVTKLRMPAAGTLSGRSMMVGFPSDDGPLDVVGVFETTGIQRASAEMDHSVSRSLHALFPDHAFEDFGGLFPKAVRSVDLRPAIESRAKLVLDALWPERGPTIGWTVRPSAEPGAGEGRGWVIIGLGMQRVENLAVALGEADEDARQQAALPWVSVFEVHPRRLIDELVGEGVALPPIVTALGAVERIRAQTLVARSDLLRGGGVIEFVISEKSGKD